MTTGLREIAHGETRRGRPPLASTKWRQSASSNQDASPRTLASATPVDFAEIRPIPAVTAQVSNDWNEVVPCPAPDRLNENPDALVAGLKVLKEGAERLD